MPPAPDPPSASVTSRTTVTTSLISSGLGAHSRRSHTPGGRAFAMAVRGMAGTSVPSFAQHVADAAQRLEKAGLGRVDLAAQVGDIGLDHVRVSAEVVVPHVVQ